MNGPRLNFGSGYVRPRTWVNLDRLDYGDQTHVADAAEGLGFADGFFAYAVAHHSLQMTTFDRMPLVLRELHRVLAEGGVLRISVPDASWAIAQWQSGNAETLPIADDIEATEDGKMLRYLFWHGDARSAFTYDSLRDMLERNGFRYVRRCRFGETFFRDEAITELDSREAESLYVEAMK